MLPSGGLKGGPIGTVTHDVWACRNIDDSKITIIGYPKIHSCEPIQPKHLTRPGRGGAEFGNESLILGIRGESVERQL